MLRHRLLGEDVEAGPAHLARLERLLERGQVDQLAAGAVDDAHTVLHLREGLGVHVVERLGGLRQVDGDDVRAGVESLGVGRALGAQLAIALRRDERVEGQHLHPECAGPLGDELADPAEAEDAERLLVHLHPAERLRSHLPLFSDACACGMLRAWASISAIVCSAAATMFDSGAFATMMPCFVAAGTSTLSTPIPARPITFRRSARSITSAVSFVAERITIAS